MGVKVKRERPDQRRHHRVTAPFFVELGAERYRVADWSLGGFRIEDFPAKLPVAGDELSLQATLPFQGFDVSFAVKAQVIRADPARRMFACQFTELGERERELMQHFIEELVRGAMVDVQDTIQRIDVPVTPASLEPGKPKSAGVPVNRWPLKAIVMTGLYALIGAAILGYTALLGYSNFYRMEVPTAVITAPIEVVSAQADGRITWSGLKPGDPVRSGDLIVNVLDNQLEREIELSTIAVKERKAQLIYYKTRLAAEFDRMKNFTTVESKNLEQAKIETESLVAQLTAAEHQYGRIAHLHQKGFATDARLEEAEKQVATLKKSLESRQVELRSRIDLANQSDGRWHYTGQNMVGDMAQLEAEVRRAEHEILLSQQRHETLINHKTRLAVHSPFDGTLLELPHVDRGAVKRGDVIAIVEQRRMRQVTAFLNQDEVMKVGQGDEVLLYVPALGETLKGRVLQIDRTSGFVKEQGSTQAPGYRWRGAVDRSAKVTIAFLDQAKVQDVDRYRSGLPVVAVFPQRSTRSIGSTLGQKPTTSM
jgi:multidrug resistance efflux pump